MWSYSSYIKCDEIHTDMNFYAYNQCEEVPSHKQTHFQQQVIQNVTINVLNVGKLSPRSHSSLKIK